MSNDIKQRANGLVWAGIVLICTMIVFGAGYEYGISTRKAQEARIRREADHYWITQMTRRHLAYWVVSNGKKTLEFRYVPKVQPTCVKFRKEEDDD